MKIAAQRALATILAVVTVAAWAGRAPRGPTVTLTSPLTNASYAAPASIPLAVSVSSGVVKVEYFQGNTLVGSSTVAPFGATWSAVPAGSYSVTARATDTAGATATSAAATLTVTGPRVVFTAPASGAALYGSSAIVSGSYVGDPATTTVLVDNGSSTRLAALNGNQFSAAVPLLRGASTFTVTVARRDRTFDIASVAVTGNDPPLVALIAPAQATFDAPASIELQANAVSPGGSISRVEFLGNGTLLGTDSSAPYQFSWDGVPRGTYTLTARAIDDHGMAATTSKSISVVAPNASPSVTLTVPADGASYNAPATLALQASAADTDGYVAYVEFLANGAVVGTAGSAPYSFNWNEVPAGTYQLAARAVDDLGAATTSAPVTVRVQPPNAPPTVTLDNPAAGASFIAPASVTLAATAADSDGSIARVDFYQDTSLIGSAAASPYTVTWTNVPAGSYRLHAVAVDTVGASTLSAEISVVVRDPPPNVPPTVSLAAPASGSELYTPSSVILRASAADSDGAIAKVDFYAGAALLGTVQVAPYVLQWESPAAGPYDVTAVATDDRGATTVSVAASVTVKDLALAIVTPTPGSFLSGDRAVVTGVIDAPFNSGVTVNGSVAAVVGNQFYARVVLKPGDNTISASLFTPDGQSIDRTITVSSDGVHPFLNIAADSLEGMAPLQVTFTIENGGTTDASVQMDDDTNFSVPAGASIPVAVTYGGAGAHPVHFTATDGSGHSISEDFTAIAVDPGLMDQRFDALWNGMNQALVAGDKATAMGYLSTSAQAKYGPVFDALMPVYAEVVANWSSPLRGELLAEIGEYGVIKAGGSTHELFLVYMLRGADGVWRLEAM